MTTPVAPLEEAVSRVLITAAIRGFDPTVTEIAAAVRAHLAAVLDAEKAAWDEDSSVGWGGGARAAIFNLRATLLGDEPDPDHERRACDSCGDVRLVGLPKGEPRPESFVCVSCEASQGVPS